MKISMADVKTENAQSYMKQLCRHWAHKFPVVFDEEQGTIDLAGAKCLLAVEAAQLKVRLELEETADQDRMERVVAEHLQRFGFRETLVFNWVR